MILEYLKLSINSLLHNKLRTFLSMIGIVIGVSVVYIIFSMTDILNYAIIKEISSGSNGFINIRYVQDKDDQGEILSASFGFGTQEKIKTISFNVNDLEKLSKENYIEDTIVNYMQEDLIKIDKYDAYPTIRRNSNNFRDFYKLNILYGKFLDDYPKEVQNNLMIVSSKLISDDINLSIDNLVGKKVQFKNREFVICGVFESDITTLSTAAIISEKAYDSFYNSSTINSFSIKLKSGYDLNTYSKIAVETLNKYHNTENTKYGYALEDLSFLISQIKSVTGILSIVMSIIASISLLVAGIGVMNIMLVSVVERTKEIGIKRAIGASKKEIRLQFIIESCLLTLIGGLLGIISGILVISLALTLLKIDMPINILYIIIAILFSIGLGFIFGYLPALRASNLNIIEAIQSE